MSCCNEPPPPEPPPPPGARIVNCAKFGKELPGLTWKPWNNALGQRVYDTISDKAWKMWTEQAKMILNEYRLNLASPEAQKFLFEQAEAFFFGPGAKLPPDFVPQMSKK
jgi:Fe-S cluster biosynthesis and repair protein YggX